MNGHCTYIQCVSGFKPLPPSPAPSLRHRAALQSELENATTTYCFFVRVFHPLDGSVFRLFPAQDRVGRRQDEGSLSDGVGGSEHRTRLQRKQDGERCSEGGLGERYVFTNTMVY